MAKIITVPSPILRKKSTPVAKLDKKILKLITDLNTTLKTQADPEGVGLSAPQLGVSKRVFIIPGRVVINPEILEFSTATNYDALKPADRYYEGCLSIPGVYGEVKRPWSIKVKYQTLVPDPGSISNFKFQISNYDLTGYDAIYFQHELDHLDGILFTDHVLEQGGKLYKQKAKGGFEEIA